MCYEITRQSLTVAILLSLLVAHLSSAQPCPKTQVKVTFSDGFSVCVAADTGSGNVVPIRQPSSTSRMTSEPTSATERIVAGKANGPVCRTKSGLHGRCVMFFQCPQLSSSPFGRSKSCGYDGALPKVCCPRSQSRELEITTPPSTTPMAIPIAVINPNKVDLFPKECGLSTGTDSKIVGGRESEVGEWPWMAAIFWRSTFRCGGAILNEKYIVTAAHCIVLGSDDIIGADELMVRLGEHNIESSDDGANPVEFTVSKIITHEAFDVVAENYRNDIALVELGKRITFSRFISPVCIPYSDSSFDEENIVGRKGTVIGWGKTRFNNRHISNVLRQVSFEIWTNRKCDDAFKSQIIKSNFFVCAGLESGGKDSCEFDSGGPYMLPDKEGRYNLVGIVSYGFKCAEPGYPGVYTRVTKYVDWLRDNMMP